MIQPYYNDQEYGITIYHGSVFDVLPFLPMVDFVYADPPYGVGKADWDGEYLTGWEMDAVNKSYGGMLVNTGTKSICTAISALGKEYKDLFYAWNKNGMTFTSIGFLNVVVAIVAGNVKLGQNFTQFSIINFNTKMSHPSPKPIEYMNCIVKRFTSEGDTILDPFMGSGTTLVSAKKTGRKAIGIEIEEKYCEIAVKRLQKEGLGFNFPKTPDKGFDLIKSKQRRNKNVRTKQNITIAYEI